MKQASEENEEVKQDMRNRVPGVKKIPRGGLGGMVGEEKRKSVSVYLEA